MTRHRVARRRRRRRTQGQHQPLARQIRRRHMANQYRQQQQYHQNDRYEERQRHEREDQDRYDYIRRRISTGNEQFEEVSEERLQEVYDWEIMQLMEQWEQAQLDELEGIAALEHSSVAQQGMQPSHRFRTLQTSITEEQQLPEQGSQQSPQTHHIPIGTDLSQPPLDSLLYHE